MQVRFVSYKILAYIHTYIHTHTVLNVNQISVHLHNAMYIITIQSVHVFKYVCTRYVGMY